MKLTHAVIFVSVLLCNSPANSQTSKPATNKKPNIIFILTDDLGYGDVGVFFQNHRKKLNVRSEPWTLTPQLDKMAGEGARLTHHYTAAPVCAPSRASLLSGLSQGHSTVRDNMFDKALEDNYTMANVLQKAGYNTAAIGKWGLQGGGEVKNIKKTIEEERALWTGYPLKRGFDYYYGYVRHVDGHEHYPKEGVYRGPKEVYENNEEISQQLDKCYTGDLWTAVAKKWIVDQVQNKKNDKPFFMYLAYDNPHAVIELPTQAYPPGGGLKGGLQYTGKPGNMINTASGTVDSWVHPDYANATYDHDKNPLTPEVAWPNVFKRYATVTRRIDDQTGDILKLLRDLGIAENTLVVFTSDNGASVESYLKEDFEANFFNSFGPFDGIKRDLLEGGERMPLIAWWPKNILPNQVIATPSIAYDWLPTFADIAGLPAPVNGNGVSLLPSLLKKGKQQESLIYAEYFNTQKPPAYDEYAPNNRHRVRKQMQMIRLGNLVGIRYDINNHNDDFEIYDILKDSHQSTNLAGNKGMEKMQSEMKDRVLQARMPLAEAPRPYDNEGMAASKVSNLKTGLRWSAYANKNYPWLPQVNSLKPIASGVSKTPSLTEVNAKGDQIYFFEGHINIPADGEYTFYLNAPNKAFLKIHNANVIDADYGYQPGTTKQNSIKLKAGKHPIKIYSIASPSTNNTISLEWQGPSVKRSAIPASAFFMK